jgi:superfamily II DNA or RNA helicase
MSAQGYSFSDRDASSAAMRCDRRGSSPGCGLKADPYQIKAIDAREERIRVVVPAGSGKTQTILNRIIGRVEKGISPDRFLILTFDNSAAKAIVSKLQDQSDGLR